MLLQSGAARLRPLKAAIPWCRRGTRKRWFSQSPGMSVLSWGTGDEGQLGQPEMDKDWLTNSYVEPAPKRIEALEGVGVVDLACGFTHAAAVIASGQLLTWGSYEHGKLGHPKGDAKFAMRPTPVGGLDKVKEVECGQHHTAVLSENGELYTWGWGGSTLSGPGALGHGNTKSLDTPTKVQVAGTEDVRLQAISSGKTHMLGLGFDGEVWSWGKGEFGRLGNGGNEDQLEPEPIDYFLDTNTVIKQVACGDSFCLALSTEGEVYGWGKNEQGQLGMGGGLSMDVYAMENFPRLIEDLANETIMYIAAGAHHAIAVNDKGELFFWGMRLWLEPHKMTILKDQRIVSAACGNNFTLALSDAGQVFSWCKGYTVRKSGVLGLGHTKRTVQPELIQEMEGTRYIQKVAAGNKFALALSGLPSQLQ